MDFTLPAENKGYTRRINPVAFSAGGINHDHESLSLWIPCVLAFF
jgi:uncharacterized membrane protein YbjE (DUF340 family)